MGLSKLAKFTTALKVGYSVLQKYEGLEAAGLVPVLDIKGVPVHVIDGATTAYVKILKRAHDDAKKSPQPGPAPQLPAAGQ